MCSWCKRIAATDWLDLDEAVKRLELFQGPVPSISHTICTRCEEQFNATL